MMDNILLGPITLYRTDAEMRLQVQDLLDDGWQPLYSRTRGKFVEEIRLQILEADRKIFKGLIISIGYRQIPKE